ncbi:hypothetical protein SeMB42_g07054 [Synchytrium endobioticum]|uniref:Uncharacterized protein n=1 Tax=Synchytrium endobioticum TaxID=286115 RepID=A0A507CGW3_9FUNG|nr:hypothetical protein SeMB42_g07054 [Synchytrium endobioticum]
MEYPSSMLLFGILNACGASLMDELCAKSDGTGLRGLNELRIYQGTYRTTGHGIRSAPSRQAFSVPSTNLYSNGTPKACKASRLYREFRITIPPRIRACCRLHAKAVRRLCSAATPLRMFAACNHPECVQLVTHVELPEWRRTDSSPEDELALKGKEEKLAELIQVRNTIYPSKTDGPSRKGLHTSLDHESSSKLLMASQPQSQSQLVEQFAWHEEAAIEQRREELGLEHDNEDPVVPAPYDWYFQRYLRTFGRNMIPPNSTAAPDDLAKVIFPNLDISARQLEVVWIAVYQVLLRLGDANPLPVCSSVFAAGDLKLNRILGLHLFLL